jgi:hypothetical protein
MVESVAPRVPSHAWEYEVVEEPNPSALQERLTRASREGWEPVNLGYAGDCRLLALLRRRPGNVPDGSSTSAHASHAWD